MAFTNFDLSGTPGTDLASPSVALAAGEFAQVRFTEFAADSAWFSVTRNGVTTRETSTDRSTDICSILGPADVVFNVHVSKATQRVVGILEGV